MEKEQIRHKIRLRKDLLSLDERRQAALEAFSRLEQTAAFLLSDNILLYHSLPDELSTLEFIEKWHTRKHFFLPRVNGVNLDILPYDKSRLHLGSFHIEEPDGDDVADINDIELIIVPSVAFDRNGNRVGRGKGYYDRLLADTAAFKIGVGYDFQLVDEIEAESHDVSLDIIITNRRTIHIRPKKK